MASISRCCSARTATLVDVDHGERHAEGVQCLGDGASDASIAAEQHRREFFFGQRAAARCRSITVSAHRAPARQAPAPIEPAGAQQQIGVKAMERMATERMRMLNAGEMMANAFRLTGNDEGEFADLCQAHAGHQRGIGVDAKGQQQKEQDGAFDEDGHQQQQQHQPAMHG